MEQHQIGVGVPDLFNSAILLVKFMIYISYSFGFEELLQLLTKKYIFLTIRPIRLVNY
jgi:hypothetical protein